MLEELRSVRLEKLQTMQQQGINPYPAKSKRTHTTQEALDNFDNLSQQQSTIYLTGRIKTIRVHGALSFMDLEDQSGKIQLFLHKDKLGDDKYNSLKNLDIGDFLEAQGQLFTTQKGQQTLNVQNFKILTKSLLPLPEKWHGLQDEEIRYRKRYLDLIMNEEVKKLFTTRTKFIQNIREFMNSKDFLEVETPTLERIPGGAEAEPFITHHNKLDIDLFLRISLELHLKRLMVGGFERIYEIGKVFRNEGISTQHLQEFTMIEFYWAYADYEQLMDFVEEFFTTIIYKTFNTLEIKYKGQVLNFQTPWPRIDYRDIIIQKTGHDINQYPTTEAMQNLVRQYGIKPDPVAGRGRLIDQLYKKTVRPELFQPCFLINHPIDISPLSKTRETEPTQVERMQVLIAGAECGNGFSELNDPIDQKERFTKQEALRQAGDKEAQMIDNDFIEALEYGMPPTAGFGVGIDRLFTILNDQENIRDVVFFPMMKPKNDQD